jgi:hypothetical protein
MRLRLGHTACTMTAKGCGAIGLLLGLAVIFGCSGTVYSNENGLRDDGGVDAATPDARVDSAFDAAKPNADGATQDAFEEYVDPGCPDAAAPVFDYACDPFAPPPGDCLEFEACYPYVEYPWDPCEAELYGSFCMPAGTQTQGEPCGSPLDCAAGFVCVVSGAGNQCVRICSLTDPSTCSNGQICEPLDVAGYGGCL